MTTMQEQVAWAMAQADPEQHGQIDETEMGLYFWDKYRDHYMILARAAISGMKKPTDAMKDAGDLPTYQWVDDVASNVWARMIDAALSEGSNNTP